MTHLTTRKLPYLVHIEVPQAPGDPFFFEYCPLGLQQQRGLNGLTPRVPMYAVAVRRKEDGSFEFDWDQSLDDPEENRESIQAEVEARLKDRELWIHRVTKLVDDVEKWTAELGWATRRIEKSLEENWIGKHRVPALIVQEDTCRIILEPVGQSSPGTEGVVDLYLMPAYDDIASLYYSEGEWRLHFAFSGVGRNDSLEETEEVVLSKEALANALAELKKHAA